MVTQYNDVMLTKHVIDLAQGFTRMILGWHYMPVIGIVEMTTANIPIDSFTRSLLGLGWIAPYNQAHVADDLTEGYYLNDATVPLNALVTAHKYNPTEAQEAILFVAEFGHHLGYKNVAEWYREGYSAEFLQKCIDEGVDPHLITSLQEEN